MLILPKVQKGIKQAMTKLEKSCKAIVGIAMIVGIASTSVSLETQASISSLDTTQVQSSMLLTPASNSRMEFAYHYSHSSHESHASHSSHASHYSSRY